MIKQSRKPSNKDRLYSYLKTEAMKLDVNSNYKDFDGGILSKWQQHKDIVLFDKRRLQMLPDSLIVNKLFWKGVADILGVSRIGLLSGIQADDFRQPQVDLVLGADGWTEHTDNSVTYVFDVTKTMFSSGNITEKLRVSRFDCSNQTVVDLYAGIGYFTLQYLKHTRAQCVHACEWNPNAIAALKAGLKRNKLEDRCVIHPGDNRTSPIDGLADRVNLGLLPTSRDGWIVAVRSLKPVGGWLHIHENLNTKTGKSEAECHLVEEMVSEIRQLLNTIKPQPATVESLRNEADVALTKELNMVKEDQLIMSSIALYRQAIIIVDGAWLVRCHHVEYVKSYAPHIYHIVLDIRCQLTS